MKKVEWDKPKIQSFISDENESLSPISEVVTDGMIVSAMYKGEIVYLEILKEHSPKVFSAKVVAFENPAKKYQGLELWDKVEIPKEMINWVHFRFSTFFAREGT